MPKLLVLDDFFPHLLTGFRVAEYNALMAATPRLDVLSAYPDFTAQHAEYIALYPEHSHRVRAFRPDELRTCTLAYLNFLNNTAMFMPFLQASAVPFVFTLYPGGGLGFGEAQSDAKLLQALASPLLKAVIVTMPVVRDYVSDFVRRHGLEPRPLHLIRGVVINPAYFADGARPLPAGAGRGFEICFVAEKYVPLGRNKGYPEFIEAAHLLAASGAAERFDLRFHVVGSFGPGDIDVGALQDRIRFYGRLETSQLRKFFKGMDLMVSPNRPGFLQAGGFDGFPTASAVEASLCGVALMLTDPLGQNPGYVDGESFFHIPGTELEPPSARWIADAIEHLAQPQGRDQVARVGESGRAASTRFYAAEYQIGGRIEVLRPVFEALGGVWQPPVVEAAGVAS